MTRLPPNAKPFVLGGTVAPLLKGEDDGWGWTPTRPLGGWLIVYGMIKADGSIEPITDRQDQVFEAAQRPDGIDVNDYLATGKPGVGFWNDTHRKDPELIVGRPTHLSFHGPDSELAKAHGKVGWWTEGYLIDHKDPRSWRDLPERPSQEAFERADRFWRAGHMLKGVPRPLGLSAEGQMALSRDRRRILWAKLTKAAVCELPVNPATTIEPMELAVQALRKAVDAGKVADLAPEDLEGGKAASGPDPISEADSENVDRLVKLVVKKKNVTEAAARRWVTKWLRQTRGVEDVR